VLIKENFGARVKNKGKTTITVGAAVAGELIGMQLAGDKEARKGWTIQSKMEEYTRCRVRLQALFEVYGMPSRLTAFQTEAIRVKSSFTPQAHKPVRPSQQIDFWSGETIQTVEDTESMIFSVVSNASNKIGVRNNVLALIMDTSMVPAKADKEEEDEEKKELEADEQQQQKEQQLKEQQQSQTQTQIQKQKEKEKLLLEQEKSVAEIGWENSNLGKSILDLAFLDDTLDAEGKVTSPIVEADRLSPASHMSTKVAADVALATTTKHKTSISPVPKDKDDDGFYERSFSNSNLTQMHPQAPHPPAGTGRGGKWKRSNKQRKVFKKSFGLSRGITPFQPRMTTNNRERLK
jgi:hypothetical protein